MSKYKVLKLQFRNRNSLIAALEANGAPYETAEIENGLHLVGYMGDTRREMATFVIRRQHIDSASNDMGFAQADDGAYRAIISDYDSGVLSRGSEMLKNVENEYAAAETIRLARARGLTVERVKSSGGTVRLKLHGRA